MLEFSNKTPFVNAVVPFTDKHGRDHAIVVVKGTFSIEQGSELPVTAEEQLPIAWGDEFHGDAGQSSVKYANDVVFEKTGTDIALVGHAHAPRGRATTTEVGLWVDRVAKVLRVFGDRHWRRGVSGWTATRPEPFERMPLVYERAFGGADLTASNPKKHDFETRNPVGTGFAASRSKERLDGLPLPNFEDPDDLVKRWRSRPAPAGFGFISPDWEPRIRFAGTYDERWERERAPLLPLDFDHRFFQSAHPDLIAVPHLQGGEPVRVMNACAEGSMQFRLPAHRIAVSAYLKGERIDAVPVLDTVTIEPDERRLALVWRAQIPCPRSFLHLQHVFIKEVG